MARRWTDREDRTLRRLYAAAAPVTEIASALGRSADAVTARRRHLGLPPRRRSPWSAREDALLRAATRGGVPATRLAASLGRPLEAVRRRRGGLLDRPSAPARYRPEEDEAIRRCFAGGGDVVVLASALGRSADAVRLHARALGAYRPPHRKRWSPPEDAVVRDGYAEGRTCASIARELPGRTSTAVAARAAKLGLGDYARRWSAEDDARLARLVAAQRPLAQIARALMRTPDAVRQRCRRLGLPSTSRPAAARTGRPWSEQEDEVLRPHAGVNPATLAQLLGRSDLAVAARLRFLGLRAGRERSPHHTAPHGGRLTPGQRSVIERTREPTSAATVLALARRLDVTPAAIQDHLYRAAPAQPVARMRKLDQRAG